MDGGTESVLLLKKETERQQETAVKKGGYGTVRARSILAKMGNSFPLGLKPVVLFLPIGLLRRGLLRGLRLGFACWCCLSVHKIFVGSNPSFGGDGSQNYCRDQPATFTSIRFGLAFSLFGK